MAASAGRDQLIEKSQQQADGMTDVENAKRTIPIENFIAEYAGLEWQRNGDELKAICPFHSEDTPSFSVTAGTPTYYCFGCGAKGDHISFIQEYDGVDFKAAKNKLIAHVGGQATGSGNAQAATQRQAPAKSEKPAEWVKEPAPANVPAPQTIRFNRDGEWSDEPVVAAWPYYNAEHRLIGYACRVEPEPGKKDVMPMTWQRHVESGEARLRLGALPTPRSLYGAELLADNPGAPVLVVEGEKAADAGRRLLAGKSPTIVVTWPGGGKAASKADWSALAGRKVLGWPDADRQHDPRTGQLKPPAEQPGIAAMVTIAGMSERAGFGMRIVRPPAGPGIDDGWDLADAEASGWSGDRVLAHLREHMTTAEEIVKEPERPEPADERPPVPDDTDIPTPDDDEIPPDADDADQQASPPADQGQPYADQAPFRILGWDRGTAFYLPADSQQVMALSASAHTKLNLLSLAPMSYWSAIFGDPSSNQNKIDWDMAADSMMRRAKSAGIFDRESIRGRGAWWEDGRVAVHIGDRVIIDGQTRNLMEAPTSYVYEAGRALKIAVGDPLPASNAMDLYSICTSLRWERALSGTLLAGWVFLAPVCGALQWRPHIWVTGGAGSGKSTVMKDVVGRTLSRNMLFVQGDTTEPGVRQELQADALPVVFDEFESERAKSQERTEAVLSLVTASSTDTGAVIAKGGQGGKSQRFNIRSMFAFSSINVQIKQAAAMSRITVLSLRSGQKETQDNQQSYVELMERIRTTITPDFIDRLQARAVAMIPTIRHNATIFAEAAAIVLGTRRAGDQIGALLAGAYALHRDGVINPEQARAWLEKQDWTEERQDTAETDEAMCLRSIMSHGVQVDTSDRGLPRRTIGELVAIAAGQHDESVSSTEANDTLKRNGIAYIEDADASWVVVANQHKALTKMMEGQPWEPPAHTRLLSRIQGARKTEQPIYMAGTRTRGVQIPAAQVM